MLTPAEELGLSGMTVAGRVRKALFTLAPAELSELMREIHDEATRRHVVYMRDGNVETIRLLPCPLIALPNQMSYLHYVTLALQNALKRLPEMYLQDFAVREVLKLTPVEDQWLWECWGPSHRESNPIFGRLDAVIDFSSPMWKDSLRFLEPNMSGIGGLNLVPTCEQLAAEKIYPLLAARDPQLRLESGRDMRELLMQEILDHLESVGRRGQNVCFVEPKYATIGIDEQVDVARFFHARHGLRVMHADPSELTADGDEVYYEGQVVDVAYRDYTVLDLIELGQAGHDIEPMRKLFRQNRVISSIAAELDQKSCWEILTDPQFTEKYFSAEERQIFRRHVVWTRILSARRTALPDGTRGSLLEFVRREQEALVLKPNRSYGGEGVLIGMATEPAAWDDAIQSAVAGSERWVVQQLAAIPVNEFPVLDVDGHVHVEPFYTVLGFAPSKYGLATLGRASQKQVVNVAQRGGICVVAIGHPIGPLLRPFT